MTRKSMCGEDDHAPPSGVFDWPPSVKAAQPGRSKPNCCVDPRSDDSCKKPFFGGWARNLPGGGGGLGGGGREGEGLSKVAISQRNTGIRRHLDSHDANEAVHCLLKSKMKASRKPRAMMPIWSPMEAKRKAAGQTRSRLGSPNTGQTSKRAEMHVQRRGH